MSRAIFEAPTIFPPRSPDRRDGQRNIDQASVLALADGLEVFNPLAAVNLCEDRWLFVETLTRNYDRYRLADRLLGSESEQPLCAAVPAEDHAMKILR